MHFGPKSDAKGFDSLLTNGSRRGRDEHRGFHRRHPNPLISVVSAGPGRRIRAECRIISHETVGIPASSLLASYSTGSTMSPPIPSGWPLDVGMEVADIARGKVETRVASAAGGRDETPG